MKNFFKKVLSVIFGILWICIIPIHIIASFIVCLITDATIKFCFKFWVLCVITLISGKGFDEYEDEEGDYDGWLYNN